MCVKFVLKKIKRIKEKCLFEKKNKHNDLRFIDFNTLKNVEVGKYTYGRINMFDFKDGGKLKIGSFCSFGRNVFICLGGEHNYNYFSTFPFSTRVLKLGISSHSKGDIIIEDDVWVGINATIMSGVKLGKGSVIAAGSIVTKSTEPFGIYGGVPAKLIKYRFSEKIREYLLGIDYNYLSSDIVSNKLKLLETEINDDNFKEVIDSIFDQNL